MMRTRHLNERPHIVRERQRIEARLKPSARDLHAVLVERLRSPRPGRGA